MKRRTKKAYANLYDHPAALFGDGPDKAGAHVTLWPNGQSELWIQDASGKHSVSVKAINGPAGLGITIHTHVGCTPITLRAYDKDYNNALPTPSVDGVREVTLTLYNGDARLQAFKRWYDRQETVEDAEMLGPEYWRR